MRPPPGQRYRARPATVDALLENAVADTEPGDRIEVIVQAIAEAHRGSVRARSTSGQGATFEMVIPAVSALPGPVR